MRWGPSCEELVSRQDIRPGDIVLDCGGYKGEYTEALLEQHDVQVIILEPQREFYELCRKKFEGNERVLVFDYGLGRKTETRPFYLGERKDSASIYEGRAYKKTGEISVKIRNAQEFFEEFNCHVAKFNIEGAEYDILDVLTYQPREILLQFHNIKDYSRKDYRNRFDSYRKIYLGRHWEIWRL